MKHLHLKTAKTYIPNKYRVRWVLLYASGERRQGQWSRSGDDHEHKNKASYQTRSGLVEAQIEVEDLTNWQTKIVVRCSKADYLEHRWITVTAAPTNPIIPTKVEGPIHGMTMVTRDKKVHIYIDGNTKIEENHETASKFA